MSAPHRIGSRISQSTIPGDDLGADAIPVNDQVRALMLKVGDHELQIPDGVRGFRSDWGLDITAHSDGHEVASWGKGVTSPPPTSPSPARAADLVGGSLHGDMVLEIPVQHTPIPTEILEYADRAGVLIRDVAGTEYLP